jgi:PAS domain S-box-containing protein
MNLNNRIALLLGSGVLITLLIGLNTYRSTQRLVTMNDQVVRTHLVLQQTEQVQARFTNLDNDLRGHLLSDNSYFKSDFQRNSRELAEQLRSLRDLTNDLANQQQRLRTLEALFHAKVRLAMPLFADERVSDRLARIDSVKRFLEISDEITALLRDAEEEDRALLDRQVADGQQLANWALLLSLMAAGVATGLIVWAILLLYRTLSSRTRLARQMQESERRLKQFMEVVPVAVFVTDGQGKFYYANQAAIDLFGPQIASDEYRNVLRTVQAYRYPSGEMYPNEERPLYRAMRGESGRVDDMEIRTGNRSVVILTSASPVYDADGSIQYVVSSSLDITDRHRSQRRLEEAKEMAEQAARVKENFLANMSHEIRTPLNAILGFSNLLELTQLTPEQADFIHAVRTAGKNLLTIVNDILDLSKIEAGMLQLERIPFSIAALVDSLHIMLQPSATDKGIKLLVKTDPGLPPVVLGDPTRLTQIVLNLAGNSIKFTEKGQVSIDVAVHSRRDAEIRVRFAVEDTGIGIAPHLLPHIFERFRQESDFTTRHYGGSGLGLNIVKSLAEMQGGRVWVERTSEAGSLFIVELPYVIAPQDSLPVWTAVGEEEPVDAQPLRVLVVEDNVMNQKLAVSVLQRMGYASVVAENGEQALAELSRQAYDVVLMDIQMPVMDGYETTRRIRKELNSNVPIIAMTAHALVGERDKCFSVGMNDFVAKPFQFDELRRVLRKFLPTSAGAHPAETPPAAPPSRPAAFNLEYLHAITGDDPEAIAELLDAFLAQTPAQLTALRQALADGDKPALGKAAHAMKASVQMLGLDEATTLLVRIQQDANQDATNATDLAPLITEISKRIEEELPYIQSTLQELQNAQS